MVQIVGTIVIGFLVGLIAKFLMPGRDPGGVIVTTLLGIAGAALANWVGGLLGLYSADDLVGFAAAVVGAIAILIVYRLVRRAA